MALFKSANPVLRKDVFDGFPEASGDAEVMTIQGTVNKTGFLLFTLFIPALYIWNLFNQTMEVDTIAPYLFTGIVGGLVTGLIISFNKHLSPFLAIIYAAFEGLAIGGISAIIEYRYPRIVIELLILTFSIFLCLLVIVLASMNLVVDFDFIEQGAAKRVPKYMEWYGAFGLMVTLIWLYLELIRLLAKSKRK
jgi:uncharacterized YccA/Bax inhibitor family protein